MWQEANRRRDQSQREISCIGDRQGTYSFKYYANFNHVQKQNAQYDEPDVLIAQLQQFSSSCFFYIPTYSLAPTPNELLLLINNNW